MKFLEDFRQKALLSPIQIPLDQFLLLAACMFWVWYASAVIAQLLAIEDPVWLIIYSALPAHVLIIAFFALKSRFFKKKFPEINPRKINNSFAWLGMVFGAVIVGMVSNILWANFLELLRNFFPLKLDPQLIADAMKSISSECQLIAMLFLVSVAAPMAEELVFRYFLYRGLKNYISASKAAVLVSFVFALLHVNLASFGGLFVLSVIFIYLYEKTQNLWTAIAAHGLSNALALVGVLLLDAI